MSKQNKVNPGQYYVAGRLATDDAARERMKQRRPVEIRAAMAPVFAPEARAVSMHAPDTAKADGQIRGNAKPPAPAKARAAAPAKARASTPAKARASATAKARPSAPAKARPSAPAKARAARTSAVTKKTAITPATKRTVAPTAAKTRTAAPVKARASGRSRK
jgi:hypothetical protein